MDEKVNTPKQQGCKGKIQDKSGIFRYPLLLLCCPVMSVAIRLIIQGLLTSRFRVKIRVTCSARQSAQQKGLALCLDGKTPFFCTRQKAELLLILEYKWRTDK